MLPPYDALVAGDIVSALSWYQAKRERIIDQPVHVHNWARLLCDVGRMVEAEPLLARIADIEEYAMFVAGQRLKRALETGATPSAALETVSLGAAARHRAAIATAIETFDLGHRPPMARHIAICGVSFCGSTVLDRILDGLPGVASIGESHWLNKAFVDGHAAPLDFSAFRTIKVPVCSHCGADCALLTPAFRTALALNPTDWYFRIAERLGADTLVSADKNLPKIVLNEPWLRLRALVVFKSPKQAWASNYSKLPAGATSDAATEAMGQYMRTWKAAYGEMVERFKPADGKVFLDFDRFAIDPQTVFPALVEVLGLEYDARALTEPAPGHSIGGNSNAVRQIRAAGHKVSVRPLGNPDIPAAHAAWIDDQADLADLHAEMMRLSAEQLGRRSQRASSARTAPSATTEPPVPTMPAQAEAPPVTSPEPAQPKPDSDVAEPSNMAPFPIATIPDEWLPRIFGRFDEVARAAAEPLMDDPHRLRQAKARFFLSLPERFSTSDYSAIQARHLNRAEIGLNFNELKYLDTPQWAGGKFDHAIRLALHESTPMRILDIGAGPGHFQMVAQYFGHETLGLDLPLTPRVSTAKKHLYNDLCDFFEVQTMDHKVLARSLLPEFPHRFDLVTSFMTWFSSDPKSGKPWSIDEWKFFLADLRDNVLTETGRVYFNLTNAACDEESWAFVKSIGEGVIERNRTLTISRPAIGAF
jgi:hypothetical protein